MNERTYNIIIYIRENPLATRSEIAEMFGTHPNNITNIKRRYGNLLKEATPISEIELQRSNISRGNNRRKENKSSLRNNDITSNCFNEGYEYPIANNSKTATLRYIHLVLTGKAISLSKENYKKEIIKIINKF